MDILLAQLLGDDFTAAHLLRLVLEVPLIIVVATTAFDGIHWFLHRCIRSRSPVLRRIGSLHQSHHEFLDEDLALHREVTGRNFALHIVPELCTQLAVTSLCYFALDPLAVAAAQLVFLTLFVAVAAMKGRDLNHRPAAKLDAPGCAFLVDPGFHALHHSHPDRYFGSYVQVFDKIFGTACHLRGRTVTLTGARGAFGAPLKELLEAEGAHVRTLTFGADWTYDMVRDPATSAPALDALLASTDVLVLAHGSKVIDAMDANCTSFVGLIERFKRLRADHQQAPEVWATGSESETHPSFGIAALQVYAASKRAFARHARRYAQEPRLLYRHIVPSAFTSRMGPGLMSGRLAARVALFCIKRGLRYVPVTYTGFAFVGFFKFLFRLDVAQS